MVKVVMHSMLHHLIHANNDKFVSGSGEVVICIWASKASHIKQAINNSEQLVEGKRGGKSYLESSIFHGSFSLVPNFYISLKYHLLINVIQVFFCISHITITWIFQFTWETSRKETGKVSTECKD